MGCATLSWMQLQLTSCVVALHWLGYLHVPPPEPLPSLRGGLLPQKAQTHQPPAWVLTLLGARGAP